MEHQKKLLLKKEVIAKLSKDEMKTVIGGAPITATLSCGNQCRTISEVCIAAGPDVYATMFECNSWDPHEDPYNNTCRPDGEYCGSDWNRTCPGGGCH